MHLIKEQALGEWLAQSPGQQRAWAPAGRPAHRPALLFVPRRNGPFSDHLRLNKIRQSVRHRCSSRALVHHGFSEDFRWRPAPGSQHAFARIQVGILHQPGKG